MSSKHFKSLKTCYYSKDISFSKNYPARIHLFKVNNENMRMCKICSQLTKKTTEQRL